MVTNILTSLGGRREGSLGVAERTWCPCLLNHTAGSGGGGQVQQGSLVWKRFPKSVPPRPGGEPGWSSLGRGSGRAQQANKQNS